MSTVRTPRQDAPVVPARLRLREAAEALGVRTVLLAYWGTTSVLARCFGKPRAGAGER